METLIFKMKKHIALKSFFGILEKKRLLIPLNALFQPIKVILLSLEWKKICDKCSKKTSLFHNNPYFCRYFYQKYLR